MATRWTMPAGWLCLVLLLVAPMERAQADDGKSLFDKQCSSCHTIGGGDKVGPDLKGVGSRRSAEWLVKIITAPDKLTADKDPAQLELVKKYDMEMPKLGVSPDDAQKLVAFLQRGSAPAAKEEAAPAAQAPAPAAVVPTKELLQNGRDLFTGKTSFAKGGAPCVSCHSLSYAGIHGGTLAADLTGAYAGMGESGMRGVLKSLSFPVMRQVYADRPLTEPETAALLALFQDASARERSLGGVSATTGHLAGGVICFIVFIIAAALYKRRIG